MSTLWLCLPHLKKEGGVKQRFREIRTATVRHLLSSEVNQSGKASWLRWSWNLGRIVAARNGGNGRPERPVPRELLNRKI